RAESLTPAISSLLRTCFYLVAVLGDFDRYGDPGSPVAAEPLLKTFHIEVQDWRDIQRQNLGHQQTTDNRKAQSLAGVAAFTVAQRDRQSTEQRGHRRHHDRTKTQRAALVDGLFRILSFQSLRLEREVDHHDGVLLDHAEQHDQTDESK